MDIVASVRKTIDERHLLRLGDAVLTALSGGPDSVAMLHILAKLRRQYRLRLSAAYVNHQIRPRIALKEAAFCENLCDELDVEFHLITEDIPALARKNGTGLGRIQPGSTLEKKEAGTAIFLGIQFHSHS